MLCLNTKYEIRSSKQYQNLNVRNAKRIKISLDKMRAFGLIH